MQFDGTSLIAVSSLPESVENGMTVNEITDNIKSFAGSMIDSQLPLVQKMKSYWQAKNLLLYSRIFVCRLKCYTIVIGFDYNIGL